MTAQLNLFADADLLAGMQYIPGFIDAADEQRLLAAVAALPFQAFAFRGYQGRRRVVSFGWAYDFNHRRLTPAPPLPAFLRPLQAAALAGLLAADLPHALVTEYATGTAIGRSSARWWASRSAYLLRGLARIEREHSIPPLEAIRYSITFRGVN